MSKPRVRLLLALLAPLLAPLPATESWPAGAAAEEASGYDGATPPRLGYVDGEVSFWRPGADEWTPARVNTALAAGDRLYAGENANLELEIGGQAYVRAGSKTRLGVANLEPDFAQIEITEGQAAIDVRNLPAGHTLEIDTPNAAFTIEKVGYYRVDVGAQQTSFATRRGGSAKVTPAGGASAAIAATEQVVIHGKESPTVATYVAPELDAWDRWNYARTDRLLDSPSARYVPQGVAGTSDLDHYGSWRVVPTYGSVWIPTAVAPHWMPYSTGRWVWDPFYGWTWVDDAPWGWAPYHYGRWVNYDGYWAWAPGPIVVRAVYAPALVAFYGGSHFGVSLSYGWPVVGWTPLYWGEPCHPWWGPRHFQGRPWWGGWGGPHHGWDDHRRRRLGGHDDGHGHDHHRRVVVDSEDDFARGRSGSRRIARLGDKRVDPLRGPVPVRVARESLSPAPGRGPRPPEEVDRRGVISTRRPLDPDLPLRRAGLAPASDGGRGERGGDTGRSGNIPKPGHARPRTGVDGSEPSARETPIASREPALADPRRAFTPYEDEPPAPARGKPGLIPAPGVDGPARGEREAGSPAEPRNRPSRAEPPPRRGLFAEPDSPRVSAPAARRSQAVPRGAVVEPGARRSAGPGPRDSGAHAPIPSSPGVYVVPRSGGSHAPRGGMPATAPPRAPARNQGSARGLQAAQPAPAAPPHASPRGTATTHDPTPGTGIGTRSGTGDPGMRNAPGAAVGMGRGYGVGAAPSLPGRPANGASGGWGGMHNGRR